MTPEEEVAYVAGIFDGEGTTATFLRGGYTGVGLQFIASISQKDVRLLEWIQQRFGGNFYTAKDGTSKLTWHSNDTYLFLLTVRPYLIVKAFNTDEMIEIWESRKDRTLLEELIAKRRIRLDKFHGRS